MQLRDLTSFTSVLYAIVLLQPALASPIGEATLEKRVVHKQSCSGDYDGSSIGVLACCDIDFKDANDITVKLSVRDSKGDSNDVYGTCYVYDTNDNSPMVPSKYLHNSQGHGTTVSQTLDYHLGKGKILAVRARGWVDDAGEDTAAGLGPSITNPYNAI